MLRFKLSVEDYTLLLGVLQNSEYAPEQCLRLREIILEQGRKGFPRKRTRGRSRLEKFRRRIRRAVAEIGAAFRGE